MTNYKQYDAMEPNLQSINARYVSLSDMEINRNNIILNHVLNPFVTSMRENDVLFGKLYRHMFYGGSYYDGLKVGSPDEYDIDLLLILPKTAHAEILTSDEPSFIWVELEDNNGVEKLCDGDYLDTKKVLSWMEGVVRRALNDYKNPGSFYGSDCGTIVKVDLQIKSKKGGPAHTIVVVGKYDDQDVNISIDLVPCFLFNGTKWPQNGFKQNPYTSPHLSEFFVVPKQPKNIDFCPTRFWRMSFQEQERVLILNKEKLKPALRLLKKLRDTQGHVIISSYYLKTVVMWEVEEQDFWHSRSLSYVFMHILKKYKERLSNKKIPYFWYEEFNLLQDIKNDTLINIDNRMEFIIKDIERNLPDNPDIIAKYLLTSSKNDDYDDAKDSKTTDGDMAPADPGSPIKDNTEQSEDSSVNSFALTLGVGMIAAVAAVGIGRAIYSAFRGPEEENRPRRSPSPRNRRY